MTTMKAAVFNGVGDVAMRADVARPLAGPGEVLIRVQACGICGSDLHIYRVDSPSAREMYAGTLRVDADGVRIIGHEFAGVIADTGPGVEGYAIGDRVVGVTGGGAMAEYVPVPVNPFQLVRMPEEVSFEEAATTEPLADSLQLVRKAAVAPGRTWWCSASVRSGSAWCRRCARWCRRSGASWPWTYRRRASRWRSTSARAT